MRTVHKVLTGSLLVVITMLAHSGLAVAHDGQNHDKETVAQSKSSNDTSTNDSYSFTTPEGGSMSVLARRAIQLYDQEDNSFNLTPAQAVYVEARLVNELGNRYLEIGEKISVAKSRIAALSKESLALDAASIAAWETYADTVDFNVSSIADQNTSTTTATTKIEDTKKADEDKDEHKSADKESDSSESSQLNWGVLAAIAAIGAAVYFLNPSRKEKVEPKAATKTSRRSSGGNKKTKK
jgi:hypothetical protein